MTVVNDTQAGRLGTQLGRRRAGRRVAVAALLACTAIAVTACSSGQISQTARQVAAVNGNEVDAGRIALRNVRIDFPGALGADPKRYSNAKGGKAVLLFSAVNSSADVPDVLTGISTDAGTVRITQASTDATAQLRPQQTLVARRAVNEAPVAEKSADVDPAAAPIFVEITNLSRDLTPGLTVDVTFTFKRNGTVNVRVPVDAGPDAPTPLSVGSEQGDAAEGHGEH